MILQTQAKSPQQRGPKSNAVATQLVAQASPNTISPKLRGHMTILGHELKQSQYASVHPS